MSSFIDKIIGNKKEWKAMEARAKALPEDYGIVYGEIKQYIWKTSGLGAIDVLNGLLGLFEESAAAGQSALAVTGTDVAGFCDELMKGSKTYTETWRKELNQTIASKLKK
jgi:DNA-binding ferritin-like protein (Dps family)